jgi:hypothetical protein
VIEHRPWTPGRRLMLALLITAIIGLLVVGALTLLGSSACACDGEEFQTINGGLAP